MRRLSVSRHARPLIRRSRHAGKCWLPRAGTCDGCASGSRASSAARPSASCCSCRALKPRTARCNVPTARPEVARRYLLAIRGGMDLHASLIPFMPAPLDPAARDESFQHVAYRGSLHSKARGQPRGGNSRLFTDARQRAMHRNGRIGHALELAIERAHAIDERARRQQRVAFEGASAGEAGRAAGDSFSR